MDFKIISQQTRHTGRLPVVNMYRTLMKPLLIFLTIAIVFTAQFSYAQEDKPEVTAEGTLEKGTGFVPCSGKNCSACDFVVLGNTAIKWLITISFLFFAVLAVRAGIKLVVSQGNPSALSDAKSSFTNAFIGLIIILIAFILVDTIMRQLVKGSGVIEGYGPWNEVVCSKQVESRMIEGFYAGDPIFTPAQLEQAYGAVDPALVGAASVSAKADCSPATLQSMGMNSVQANTFSCIAEAESTCRNNPPANPSSSASGLFQITLGWDNKCHNLNLPQCASAVGVSGNLNCSKAFSGGKVKAGMEALASQCKKAASNQKCNVAAALCIYDTEGGYGAWLGTKANPHPKQRACVAKFAK